MVHLATVKRDSENVEPLVKRVDSIKLETTDDDDFYSTVYGTRFAAEQLPQTEMPEKEMPREVAYRMIKDELSLDGNPMLNLASFVTTYMVCGLHLLAG
jgi:glutamate decarboxylase